MKAKRIWIATHIEQPYNQEVSFTEPQESYVTIYSETEGGDNCYAEWKPYILLELEE